MPYTLMFPLLLPHRYIAIVQITIPFLSLNVLDDLILPPLSPHVSSGSQTYLLQSAGQNEQLILYLKHTFAPA